LEPSGAVEQVTILLVEPGTYDCEDPNVDNGERCDDRLYCTEGETCSDGYCGGGRNRDCGHVIDDCNVSACSEELGCYKEPSWNGFGCWNGDFCTIGDTCVDGECQAGVSRDCSVADGVCRRGVCDEYLDVCVSQIDDTLSCEDGFYCTYLDVCSLGTCSGLPVSCAVAANDCNLGECSELLLGACTQVAINEAGPCDTNCMTDGTCASGVCVGGIPTGASETEGPVGDPTCVDFIDNDCDTFFDADDPDCAL
jgi:hypothetical protein